MSRSSSRPESVINSINDANSSEYAQSNDGLPSYEDVLREEEQGITYGNPSLSQSNNHLNVPRPPQRPPQKPPRPNTSSHSSIFHHHHSHHGTGGNSATSGSTSRPPPTSSHQTKPSYRPPPPSTQSIPSTNSRIPWVYPSNFHCPKCNNTGYKLKNGKSCRSCWRRFAPTNQISYNPGPSSSMFVTPMGMMSGPSPPQQYGGYGYAAPQQPQRPLVVRPGDPRLGGVICGECRGTGRVSFFLDDDICTLCNGLGRIIPRR